jgi:hypothetical protein
MEKRRTKINRRRPKPATRAFISVRRALQSEPDFDSAVNIGGFLIYFSVLFDLFFSPMRGVFSSPLVVAKTLGFRYNQAGVPILGGITAPPLPPHPSLTASSHH